MNDKGHVVPASGGIAVARIPPEGGTTYVCIVLLVVFCCALTFAQQLPREQWGAPSVSVSRLSGKWTIAGKRNKVTLNESNLSLTVQAGPAEWQMVPSSRQDMLVRFRGKEFYLRLADAQKIEIKPYDTGSKTGVKITLAEWRPSGPLTKGTVLDLRLFLTVCLEGKDEELVFDIAASEHETILRQLDWPTALDARDVDHTLLSNGRGNLLPRSWPKEFYPIRTITPEGKVSPTDKSVVQSNVIESWSMSWWGFQKGRSAMMIIVETPNDAAYQFQHPAGGPTVIGPRWRATLGRFGYPRTARMCFVDEGDYVALAKRYRRYAMDTGLFVSLKEKIARTPAVKRLIGTPITRMSILRNLKPDSSRYDQKNPEKNFSLTTFDDRLRQLRELKAKGIERLHVCLTGWPHLGYDRQHPDELPPPPQAGGWEGMKRLTDACHEIDYVLTFHDQYRDYYVDAPSYDPQFAVHEEDKVSPPQAFPGTRFGDWKEDYLPFMRHWDGGKQTFLSPRFMLGHLIKNYQLLFDHGIKPNGIYLDVFGYVPPDEDFNPEHPTTRTESINARALCYNWTRNNVGIVGTEAACDWTVPYSDISSPLGPAKCVTVPLFNLVYHDAIITPYRTGDIQNILYGLLNGGLPQIGDLKTEMEKNLDLIRQMAALHERLALLEMTQHEFLDKNYRKERTTFADGTTVTVDWDTSTFTISPEMRLSK
jgi:Family of unknown function (DUF5696)